MNRDRLIAHALSLEDGLIGRRAVNRFLPEAMQMFRQVLGPGNHFEIQAKRLMADGLLTEEELNLGLSRVVAAFRSYLMNIHEDVTPERRAQLALASDLLEQADDVLGN